MKIRGHPPLLNASTRILIRRHRCRSVERQFQAQISPLAETWHCTAQVCPSGVAEDVGPRAASAVQELAKQCLQTAAEV